MNFIKKIPSKVFTKELAGAFNLFVYTMAVIGVVTMCTKWNDVMSALFTISPVALK